MRYQGTRMVGNQRVNWKAGILRALGVHCSDDVAATVAKGLPHCRRISQAFPRPFRIPEKLGAAHWRPLLFLGGDEEDRTPDLRIANAEVRLFRYPTTHYTP